MNLDNGLEEKEELVPDGSSPLLSEDETDKEWLSIVSNFVVLLKKKKKKVMVVLAGVA